MTTRPARAQLLRVVLAGVLSLPVLPGSGAAASCGGGVPCRCGDTATADYTLPGDLGPCPGHGLVVRSHVRLDCRGFKIRGLGDGSEQYGIFLAGKSGSVTGATVKGCRVSGFLRGIRLRAADGNIVVDNVASDNGDFRKHVGYGIDLSGESRNNILQGNTVQRNADEGVHIGRASHGSRLTENVITDSHRENLYLLAANGGVFLRNTIGGSGVNSLYLKDSSANYFEGNTFGGATARVIGDSHENRFVDNTFSATGLHFRYYKGSPSRRPAGNRVTGGSIRGAVDCLRFTSSSGNVVEDTVLRDCRTEVRSEAPAGPSENAIVGHAPEKVTLDEGSILHMGWRLAIHVQDAGGAPLGGAQVEVRDASGTPVVNAATDENGNTPAQVISVSTRSASTTASRTPHTLSIIRAGYAPDVRVVSMTQHLNLTISLRPQ